MNAAERMVVGRRTLWVFPIVMPVMMVLALLIGLFIMREFFGGGPWWRDGAAGLKATKL
jgi:hypothetical protein